MRKASSVRWFSVLALLIGLVAVSPVADVAEARALEHPWSVSLMGGMKDFEGDEPVDDSTFVALAASYDYSMRWTFEGVMTIMPDIDGSERWDLQRRRFVNRLEVDEGTGETSTSAFGLSLECLYHITRWKRLDPYFVVGAGFMFYADDFGDTDGTDALLTGGAGVMYHFNNEWAIRADARAFFAGIGDVEANSQLNGGVVWTIGAHVEPDIVVLGEQDSDADGLSDAEELEIGTDPQNPDTDGDDLSDFDEVTQYDTNPLDPDTDLDMLTDGEEVHVYKTDPGIADTDSGGVRDGHEVLEDGTDPLDGSDDLLLFTLHIEFDTDKWFIKPEYFEQLDVVCRVLGRTDRSTVKIEGHADKRRRSSPTHNQRLSERRARAVQKYLEEECRISSNRITTKGFGFARPIESNDPKHGNRRNRRVELYIQGAGAEAGDYDDFEAAVRATLLDHDDPATHDASVK